MITRTTPAAVLTTCALLVGACGGSDDSSSSETPQATATATPAATATARAGTKVSANTASQDEIVAALEAAGVDNAERWADEVEEYRPYDDGDANLPKLRDELAKYNPGEGVVDKIVSALEP